MGYPKLPFNILVTLSNMTFHDKEPLQGNLSNGGSLVLTLPFYRYVDSFFIKKFGSIIYVSNVGL